MRRKLEMNNTKELHELISEIESLINERTKPDGFFPFDGAERRRRFPF
jgi:hypothetical protein